LSKNGFGSQLVDDRLIGAEMAGAYGINDDRGSRQRSG
jgi:hypothetical protein